MAQTDRDRRIRGCLGVLAAASAALCLSTYAASDKLEDIVLKNVSGMRMDDDKGTLSAQKLQIVQGTTVLNTNKAEGSGIVDGELGNSRWKLTGGVHFLFDGAVLDAPSATVIFENGRMKSVQAEPASATAPLRPPTGPVHVELKGAVLDARTATVNFLADNRIRTVQILGIQGAPAQFSHQFRNSKSRALGRAGKIDYDAAKNQIRMSGGTWYSKGSAEYETDVGIYDLGTGVYEAPNESRAVIKPEERVPPPNTPDRSTAK